MQCVLSHLSVTRMSLSAVQLVYVITTPSWSTLLQPPSTKVEMRQKKHKRKVDPHRLFGLFVFTTQCTMISVPRVLAGQTSLMSSHKRLLPCRRRTLLVGSAMERCSEMIASPRSRSLLVLGLQFTQHSDGILHSMVNDILNLQRKRRRFISIWHYSIYLINLIHRSVFLPRRTLEIQDEWSIWLK